MPRLFAVAVMYVLLAPPVSAQGRDPAAVLAEMVAAVRDRDVPRWSAMFAEDAVMNPPAGTRVAGRAAIRAFWERAFANATGSNPLSVTVHATHTSGDLAVIEAAYGPDGAPPVGQYLLVLARREGTWWIQTWTFTRTPPAR